MARLETREDGLYIEGKKVLKGWESWNGWYWFALEDLGEQEYEIDGQTVRGREYFGFVQGHEQEYGNFTLAEMQPLIERGKIWEILERDLRHSGRRA